MIRLAFNILQEEQNVEKNLKRAGKIQQNFIVECRIFNAKFHIHYFFNKIYMFLC